jgi:3-hydroxy-3-methylglutaryl CoA synthase
VASAPQAASRAALPEATQALVAALHEPHSQLAQSLVSPRAVVAATHALATAASSVWLAGGSGGAALSISPEQATTRQASNGSTSRWSDVVRIGVDLPG